MSKKSNTTTTAKKAAKKAAAEIVAEHAARVAALDAPAASSDVQDAPAASSDGVTQNFTVVEGEKGTVTLPPYAVVLTRESTRKGEKVTRYLAVTGARRQTTAAQVLPLLILLVAEARAVHGYNSAWRYLTINGEQIDTRLMQKSIYGRYLSATQIQLTDANGEIRPGVSITFDGQKLNTTPLKIKKSSPLLTATGAKLTALLKHTAQATAAAATYRKEILANAKAMHAAATAK